MKKKANRITKTVICLTIDQEEEYLNKMCAQGWKPVKIMLGLWFTFEKCEPGEYIVRVTTGIDPKGRKASRERRERIPAREERHHEQAYNTIPLGIILTEDNVVTVCSEETSVLSSFHKARIRDLSTENRLAFVYRIMLRIAMRFQRRTRLRLPGCHLADSLRLAGTQWRLPGALVQDPTAARRLTDKARSGKNSPHRSGFC